MQKLHANARKKAHIRYDSSDDSVDDVADDLVNDFADDFFDNLVDDLFNDFVDDFADDFIDDLFDDFADDFVHLVHFVDEDDVFSTSSEAFFVRKTLFKVFISIRKRASAKKKILLSLSSLSSSKIIIYLLNVKMMYEKNVIFQIFISCQVNFESIAYDVKAFYFINHKMNMKKKARKYANAKIFACHLINVKKTIM
jgi:hypothetical protein